MENNSGLFIKNRSQSGQILLELIVAVVLAVFVSVSIALTISVSLRSTTQSKDQTAALLLSQELVEASRAFSLESWHNLGSRATSSANTFFATTTSGKWTYSAGTENITLNNIVYTRYFWIDDVFRSTSTGDIVASGGYWDPSTKKLTTMITWDNGGEFSQIVYISRYSNAIYTQTDWSGGAVGDEVVTLATTTFATSTNIDFASTTGSIKLQPI